MRATRTFILTVLITLAAAWSLGTGGAPAQTSSPGPGSEAFSYNDYAAVLRTYVDPHGMVNYKGLKANRGKLDAFVSSMGRLDPALYDKWADAEKIAFWINAYNAVTLKIILDHYPIKPSFFKLAVFPKHSIWHISGVWSRLKRPMMGRMMSLNDIEHETLRKDFSEPRIHVALVCASISCPPLRVEPYVGGRLETQLEDQVRRFLANPVNFRIDRAGRRVYLSSIFKWFGEDFVKRYGTQESFNGRGQPERAVLNFVSGRLDGGERGYLKKEAFSIHYTDYDWSLNEQREG